LIPPDPGIWWDLVGSVLIPPPPTCGIMVVEFWGFNEIALLGRAPPNPTRVEIALEGVEFR
jgi:hypothetical protein